MLHLYVLNIKWLLVMKVLGKFSEIHINPIYRDLLVVILAGVLIAMSIVTIGFMIFH